MQVTIEYAAQVKRAAGLASEYLDVDEPCSVQQLIGRIAKIHGGTLSNFLLDGDGGLQRSILLFVGDDQVRWETARQLRDGDVVSILSPISGG